MLRSLLILSIVGCAFGQFFNSFQNGDMKKFSDGKVMETCLGKGVMDEVMGKMFAAVAICYGSPQDNEIMLDFSIMPPMAAAMMAADKMNKTQEKATAFVANATCMMRELEMIKEDGSPNYEVYDMWISSLNLTTELMGDLLEAHNLCKSFAECAPVDTIKCPITRRLGRIMAFEKCTNAKYLEACMWEDMRMLMSYTNGTDPGMMEMMMNFDNVLSYGDVMKVMDM